MSGKKKHDRESETSHVDQAAANNLIGFFALLLEIDMRNNPDLYRTATDDEHD